MEYTTLSTGAQLPLLGLGTWQAKDEAELTNALEIALKAGYRLIDTAAFYQNEHIIGKVLKQKFASGELKRQDIFITTKLPPYAHDPRMTERFILKQLEALQVDYVDLFLIHVPCVVEGDIETLTPKFHDGKFIISTTPHIDTWRVLEKLCKEGKLKSLGVSNFSIAQLTDLYEKAEIKPSNHQVECHIYFPQNEMIEFCKSKGITVTAYGPIGSPGRKQARADGLWPEGEPLSDPVVLELAEKYGKTPAQILLRHLTQRQLSVIPKSTNPERLIQNFNIFDFKLSPEDVEKLNSVKTRVRLFIMDFIQGHPFYPYDDVDQSKFQDYRII